MESCNLKSSTSTTSSKIINNFNDFNQLSDEEISTIVKSRFQGCNTIVYAFDGTRRSYLIESTNFENENHQIETVIDYDNYCKTAIKKLLYDIVMMCQHGVKTIVYPMWFCTLEDRGPAYLPKFIKYLTGLSELVDNDELVQMYRDLGIRVIFYGEYELLLKRGNNLELLEKFKSIMELTKDNTQHTILLGTNIQDPTQTIIDNVLECYNSINTNSGTNNGTVAFKPTSQELIKHYYGGVEVEPVTMYLGFDRFSTDGRPIFIADKGNEDLYYTISPHKLLSKNGWRKVLFDKLFCRSIANAKEYTLKISDIVKMKQFYVNNTDNVMGVGNVNPNGNYWYPSPQVIVPSSGDHNSVVENTANSTISASVVASSSSSLSSSSSSSSGLKSTVDLHHQHHHDCVDTSIIASLTAIIDNVTTTTDASEGTLI